MKRATSPLACLAILAALASSSGAVGQDAVGDPIGDAIDKGIEFLRGKIEAKQIPDQHKTGQVALETYALVVAGVSVDDPLIVKNIELLKKAPLNHTYTVACIAFAIDAVLSQIEADQFFITGREARLPRSTADLQSLLEKCVNAMVRMQQKKNDGWNYGPDGERYDNSNVQFAVLALGIGAKRQIPIAPEVWERVAKHFVAGQQKQGPEVAERIELVPESERGGGRDRIDLVDRSERRPRASKKEEKEQSGRTVVVKPVPEIGDIGDEAIEVRARGWSYIDDEQHKDPTWNMTCAGLSSLILAAENLKGRLPVEFLNKVNTSIRDGYGWMLKNWNPFQGGAWNYYGIYSLEKVGDLGHVKKFGVNDWYEQVSQYVVKEQAADGSWPGDNDDNKRINTSFALLVLNRATSLLTQRANRMVITGAGAGKKDDDRDNWVYVQSMDREFHLPTLFRMVRLRPNPALAKFITLVVESYPIETRPKMVPILVKSFERVTDPRFKKFLLDHLVTVAGTTLADGAAYTQWFQSWSDAERIGTEIKKDRIADLLKIYEQSADSLPLKNKVLWALARCQASAAMELFVKELGNEEPFIRESAYIGLTTLPVSGDPLPPFDAKAASRVREKQVLEIEAWVKKVRG